MLRYAKRAAAGFYNPFGIIIILKSGTKMRNCKKAYCEALKPPKFRKNRGAVGQNLTPEQGRRKKPSGGYRQKARGSRQSLKIGARSGRNQTPERTRRKSRRRISAGASRGQKRKEGTEVTEKEKIRAIMRLRAMARSTVRAYIEHYCPHPGNCPYLQLDCRICLQKQLGEETEKLLQKLRDGEKRRTPK